SVYTLRREILEGKVHITEEDVTDSRGYAMATAEELLDEKVDLFAGAEDDTEEWDFASLRRDLTQLFSLDEHDYRAVPFDSASSAEIRDTLWERIQAKYAEKEQVVPRDILARVERDLMLQIVDQQWKDHLYSLDHLKEGIGLRGYGQRDPLVEYKKESFDLFKDMRRRIEEEIVRYLWWLRPVVQGESDGVAVPVPARQAPRRQALNYNNPAEQTASVFPPSRGGGGSSSGGALTATAPAPARVGGDDAPIRTVRREEPKIGRNDPCWCGSGKKFKKCHGAT
ncbi:MAG: SEC-C metal-binding domain-containing protein, partial [Acidobacteriota bacterium]|nr:SEC-C metal-binding domain-containing protein [Acidobacteriota bacterium]